MDTCCRTCSRNDNFQGISVDAISENNQEPVYLMLIYCTQLQFSNRDSFPQQICYDCMTNLDAAYSFWKQCRQADSHLQQQLMFVSGTEPVPADTNTPDPSEGQTQLVEQPAQDDEGAIQVEECKLNAQTQIISIDEDVESCTEVETAEPVTSNEDGFIEEGSLLQQHHQQYIIDSDAAESGGEEEQEPEPVPVPVYVPRPTLKIKINRNKKHRLVTTGKLKCNVCRMSFNTSSLLHRHMMVHKTTCEHCTKTFSTEKSLNRHRNLNCPVLKNITYIAYCKHCNRGFSNLHSLAKHESEFCPVLHPNGSKNAGKHQCKYCSKGFSSNQNVLRHQRENCPVLKRPTQQKVINIQKQCAYCRKRFNTSKEVKRHLRHCLRRRPLNLSVTPASNGQDRAGPNATEDINSPDYEVHPSELLDCVMKQEPNDA